MSNSKLLLVDDEPLNLKLFQKMLKDNDYQIITATNGQECLAKAEEMNPDLILMDWNMPVMDGLEALKRLKQDEATKDIPVLMITGVMTSSEDLALAMSIGAIDFLKKPFEKLELNARINNILLLSNTLKVLKDQNNSLENKNIFISSLLESVPHPVIYCSLEGVLLMCNHFFEKLIDKNKIELLGKSIYRLFLSEEIGFHVQKDIELVEKGTALAYEKNGFPGNKTFIISKNVVRDSHDKPLGIITAFTDISELKKANEDIINNKKIELISSALKMTHLNEMNTSLINDLEKVLPHATKEGQDLIRKMTNKFKMNMAEQVWNDFETRFESAFDSFYRILLERFPNLTPNERKLCALLRSGLSSKDIAVLTFQNPQSVDVARYRLRKKLNLVNEENLTDFLLLIDKTQTN
ncbi:response regulator [Sunxiuqinia elliptica]|uniref:PAS domain S-box-containing protein n=1 Tax=Sunxiuqinia elliptica TaxID=655355 RepID=A0A4R6GPA7_9BACT|nr:response regulator [Sunxiuqinia elliptica]TDN97099.1 PAS domain S-box-containing protein [Sunxiuqinia elliptica]TDO60716.1 PAS domain S-box-containing protein [Sunxiuqinia elliptica]